MSKKIFIEEVEKLKEQLSEEALKYFELLKEEKPKEPVTEKGLMILNYLKTLGEDAYSAADIGAGIGIAGRSASGTLQKLSKDGFIEKVSSKPSRYIITAKGKEYKKGEE